MAAAPAAGAAQAGPPGGPPARLWRVLGGADKGGILVRQGRDLGSAQLPERLSTGALVREVALVGERLQYLRVEGAGPTSGWVSIRVSGKDLLARDAGDVGSALAAPPDPLASGDRPFDVIIYGASGFTGRLCAEHLDATVSARGNKLKWAVAGRNAAKLQPIEQRSKSGPQVFQVNGPEELERLAGTCRVLIAAAGPYQLCGEDAVRACVRQGTHYVDVTGEIPWVHDMVSKYHGEARSKGVMVVHCAGQVCTPDEVMCYLLARKLGPLRRFREYFCQVGGMSGGTFATSATTLERMTSEVQAVSKDPFCLGGARRRGTKEEDKDCEQAEQDPVFPSLWLQPSYSSTTGSRIIRRTCHLFETSSEDTLRYGEDFSVTIREPALNKRVAEQQVKDTAQPSVEDAAQVAAGFRTAVAGGQMPRPGQGPPAEVREMYYSDAWGVAEGEDGKWAHVHYTGPEAYEVTAICSVTAALCLVEEADRLQPAARGGVVTPAFALHGSTFIERLEATPFANGGGRKMKFEVLDGKPAEAALKKTMTDKTRNSVLTYSSMESKKLKAFA